RHWLDLEIPAVGLSHSSIRNHIAALYLKEGKFAEAQASMDDDGSHWAMRLLMELKLKTGKIPQARRHARDILERYGDFTNAYASACSLHWALG
ncbi:MAG: hypothetical protein HYZ00_12660, partial [Candidatus Hydrogenedentes bacterium]|nr:hypothetical protein [Candidatus Hydrogenedentota bacterium]